MKLFYYALMLALVSVCSVYAMAPKIGFGDRAMPVADDQNKQACDGKSRGSKCVLSGVQIVSGDSTCQPVPAKPGITGLATQGELTCTLSKGAVINMLP